MKETTRDAALIGCAEASTYLNMAVGQLSVVTEVLDADPNVAEIVRFAVATLTLASEAVHDAGEALVSE